MGVAAFIGSFLGANLVLEISMGLLRKIIAIATVLMLIIIIAQPRLGLEKRKRVIKGRAYGTGIFITFIIGVYGGFYGAMAGTFHAREEDSWSLLGRLEVTLHRLTILRIG